MVRKEGLQYRTAARVVRLAKGYGLKVQVAVTVTVCDGRSHGLYGVLTLSGIMRPMTRSAPGWGFGGGVLVSTRVPQIRPGQRRVSRTDYPYALRGTGVMPDYRFLLTVLMSGVTHYAPRRHRTPAVAVVILTVPLRGPPRIRYKLPIL